jgi:hypothetical protein
MTILKSNSGKMLEYLTIELNSGWDVDDLADALLVDKWTVEEIEKLTYKEITKAVKESIVYNGRAKIEDAYQDIINYKTNHKLVVNIINNLVPELSTSQRGSLENCPNDFKKIWQKKRKELQQNIYERNRKTLN